MVIKGMATWLSWTEAEVSTQETGIWPQATSMWSLYRSRSLCSPCCFSCADVAGGGQVGEHLAEVLRDLPLETRRLRLRTLFVLARASALARRRGLSGAGGSSLPSLAFIWTGFSRASISVASRAIAPMMRPPSARSISAAWILSGSSPRANSANARETWLRKELARVVPSRGCDAGLVDVEALDQGAGGGNAQDRLGHESSGRARRSWRPAWPPGGLGNEGFEADHIERGDDTTQRFGDRIVVLAHPREQKALDVAPASLHRVERLVRHVYSQG